MIDAPSEEELAELQRDIAFIRSFVRERRSSAFRCGYCGAHCFGRVCASHRDLPQAIVQQLRGTA